MQVAVVKIWGTLVGAVAWDTDNGLATFEYDTFKGLPGLLADALPDKYGNQLINLWLAQQGRPQDSMNPVEKLCFIGTRGMGALEFEPAVGESIRCKKASEIVDEINDTLNQWKQFANEVEVKPTLRDEIAKTLLNL